MIQIRRHDFRSLKTAHVGSSRKRAQGMIEYIMLLGLITLIAFAAIKPVRDGMQDLYLEQRANYVLTLDVPSSDNWFEKILDGSEEVLEYIYYNMY